MTITLQELYLAAKDGLSQSEAAERLGVSRQYVNQQVQMYWRRGITLDFTEGTRGVKPIPVEVEVLQEMVEDKKTCTEVAQELGVSYGTAKSCLDENGLSPHRRIRHKRPGIQDTRPINITVPGDVLDWVKVQAKREKRSISWFVSDALEAYREVYQGEDETHE